MITYPLTTAKCHPHRRVIRPTARSRPKQKSQRRRYRSRPYLLEGIRRVRI